MTTPKSQPRPRPGPAKRSRQKAPPPKTPAPELLEVRGSPAQLLGRFHRLLSAPLLASWMALSNKEFYQRAFTPLVTLWYCVFQRLGFNPHLSHVVEDALAGGADRLSPRGKPLSRQLSSEATTSFSDARQRLPLDLFHKALRHIADRIGLDVQAPRSFGLRVALVDGSTVRLRSSGDIPREFPPHRPGNCKKEPYWCLARVVGMFALATGCVLDRVMGSCRTSEQALCALLLQRPWKNWLLVGDRNFGVYSVVRAAVAAQARALFRLTKARAAKLARAVGQPLLPGLDATFDWFPSRQDQCPAGLAPTPVRGRLIAVRVGRPGFRPFTLYLFTTLLDEVKCPARELAQLYAERWNVELCLRHLKAQMGLGFLECRSAGMARKEWLAGLIAHNLIRWTMAVAAATARVPAPSLSFSRARELVVGWCVRSGARSRDVASWQRLLGRIARARLPKRRKRRPSEPRAVRAFQKDVAKLEGSRAAAREKLAQSHANS